MSFDIDVDIDEAIKMTEKHFNIFGKATDMQALGDFLVDKIRSEIQNQGHVVTGELLAETKVLEVAQDYVVVGNKTIQAAVLENGRIEVRPKNAKVLHWIDPHTGQDVFSKKSRAVEATHLFERTIRAGVDEYMQKIADELKNS